MRTMLLATAAMLCAGGTALAQTADTGPLSTQATHIDKADTGSTISPRLPAPSSGDSSPDSFLMSAKKDVQAGRTGAAQEALERAETRLLDRSTEPSAANQPDTSPRIEHIHSALRDLASKDKAGTIREIDAAMGSESAPMTSSTSTTPMPVGAGAPKQPLNTPIAPGGTSGTTPATATGGTATGTGAVPTAVGGTNGSTPAGSTLTTP